MSKGSSLALVLSLFLLPLSLGGCADRAPGDAAAAGEVDPAPGLERRSGEGGGDADPARSDAADPAGGAVGEGGADRASRPAGGSEGSEGPLRSRASAPPPPVRIPESRPRFEPPEHVRGIYLNAWTAGSSGRLEELIRLARDTEVNAFVIDVKEGPGQISYSTSVPAAREVGAVASVAIRDPVALLRRLEEEGIYPIARIVVVRDETLAAARPELAVQDTAGGVWVDSNGSRWLNPFHPDVLEYHLALAREAAELGFPEIQWDYIRFPDAPRDDLRRAAYPGREGRTRSEAIRDFLRRSREALAPLGVRVTADVFGATTSGGDIGIGQVWEEFIDVVDVALPMVYPSHYWPGAFGFSRPSERPYEIVRRAIEHAVRRSEAVEGAGAVRPWLQDFSLGFPEDRVPDIRAQIHGAYDAGVREWILWNPASRYTRAALEPAGGWRRGQAPPIRIAGRLVTVEDRFRALRTAARNAGREPSSLDGPGEFAGAEEPGAGDGAGAEEKKESGRSGERPYRVLDPDSLRRHLDSILTDTVRIGRDTIR